MSIARSRDQGLGGRGVAQVTGAGKHAAAAPPDAHCGSFILFVSYRNGGAIGLLKQYHNGATVAFFGGPSRRLRKSRSNLFRHDIHKVIGEWRYSQIIGMPHVGARLIVWPRCIVGIALLAFVPNIFALARKITGDLVDQGLQFSCDRPDTRSAGCRPHVRSFANCASTHGDESEDDASYREHAETR